jgi:hypothetical protein
MVCLTVALARKNGSGRQSSKKVLMSKDELKIVRGKSTDSTVGEFHDQGDNVKN